MAKRTRVGNNDYDVARTVVLLPASVDKICDELATQIQELRRHHRTRADDLDTKLNEFALAVSEHGRATNEYITKFCADHKHTYDTLQQLKELHSGETTLEELPAIEDHQREHLPRAGTIPETGGNGVDHPRDLDEGQS